MVSLSLAVGQWSLSFELGRTPPDPDPPEEGVERVSVGDGTEVSGALHQDVEATAGYGFTYIVGEAGPELWSPDEEA